MHSINLFSDAYIGQVEAPFAYKPKRRSLGDCEQRRLRLSFRNTKPGQNDENNDLL